MGNKDQTKFLSKINLPGKLKRGRNLTNKTEKNLEILFP